MDQIRLLANPRGQSKRKVKSLPAPETDLESSSKAVIGRPRKQLSVNILEDVESYLEMDSVPSLHGLARFLDCNITTLRERAKMEPEFQAALDRVSRAQADDLIRKGLTGEYNPTICKLLLAGHGIREETVQQVQVQGIVLHFDQTLQGL